METVYLKHPTHGIVDYLENSNQKDKNLILKDILNLKKEIEKMPVGVNRFKLIGKAIDRAQAKDNANTNLKVSCKKGCSSCCYIPVHVTNSEAEILTLLAKELKVDIEKMKLQAKTKNQKEWMALPLADSKCVFLHHDVCSIYEVRPLYCRTFKVVSNPKYCNTKHQHLVRQKLDLTSEILHNALINAEGEIDAGNSKTIPQAILERFD